MRRYTITVNDNPHVLDVERLASSAYRVTVAGRTVDVAITDSADTSSPDAASSAPAPTPAANAPAGPPAAAPRAAAAAAGGPGAMTAPMPGVILSVETSVGASVKRGQALLILEAMKMNNTLAASRDGVVAEILVQAGQQVKYGDVLLKYEA